MRVHLVSDVHGNAEALSRAKGDADALVCLGDLLNFVDYYDLGGGIMGQLFGEERIAEWVALRTARRFDEARAYSARMWASLDEDRQIAVDRVVRAQYAALFGAMPDPTYVTYGNVDLPDLWPDYKRDGVTVLDGQTVTLDGWTFGFVGGGLRSPMRTPYELSDEEYAAKLEAVGEVDVLCCHIPPALPELTYDTVARRFEKGSEAILDVVRRTQPRYMVFGHVHQPLVRRTRIGRTECINVGHFRRTETAFPLTW